MALYGKVEHPEDIRRINCIIRDEMLEVEDEAHLSELKKRSDYLCTLSYSPFWKKRFGERIEALRSAALEENRITVKEANLLAAYRGMNKSYSPWRARIDIEEQLKEIPRKVSEEIAYTALSLEAESEILELLRREFCRVRAGMVLCEEEECLKRLKRAVDILSVLPFLDSFKEHFDKETQEAIDAFVAKEKFRSVKLANIISDTKGWESLFHPVGEEDFAGTGAEELMNKLLEEEEKSDTYIPTEARYKDGGRVLWLVYYHPGRKREYAKRIYLPATYRNLVMEGPGEFENRFGHKVWGVKIRYEAEIRATTIRLRGREIRLPERWVKREKVVPLPENAENVRLLEERPESAMNIA